MNPVRFHDAARIELLNEIRYYTGISCGRGMRVLVDAGALIALLNRNDTHPLFQ